MGGTHWCAFYVKKTKSFYFDSFCSQPDKFLLNQLTKPITYHFYKIQDKKSNISGSFCLYFFFLIERAKYYDSFIKMYFEDQFHNLNNAKKSIWKPFK